MALHMAVNLAKHGARVTLFLDREGVRIADQRLPIDTLAWGESNVGADYDELVAAGVRVVVCPGCAANQSLTAEYLRKGAVMGTPDSVAELMLGASKVIDF
jgi:sulfur relay (sulfurtransferase) complex TusBCD TusD component (DsrE family)